MLFGDESNIQADMSVIKKETSSTGMASKEKGSSIDKHLADIMLVLQQHTPHLFQIFKEDMLLMLSKSISTPNVLENMSGRIIFKYIQLRYSLFLLRISLYKKTFFHTFW